MAVYIDTGDITNILQKLTNDVKDITSAIVGLQLTLSGILDKQAQEEGKMADLAAELTQAVSDIQAARDANLAADQKIQAAVQQAVTLLQQQKTGGTVSDEQVQAAIDALEAAASENAQATQDYFNAADALNSASASPADQPPADQPPADQPPADQPPVGAQGPGPHRIGA